MFESDFQTSVTDVAASEQQQPASADRTVWMVTGNKGGVGKSLFCLALASALEGMGKPHRNFAVLDGDGRTGDVFKVFARKIPCLKVDFRELRPDSHSCKKDSEYEDIIHQFLYTSHHLIINTPDGADEVLLRWFDLTLKHTEPNNIKFKMIYLMSDRPDGLNMLQELSKRYAYIFPFRNLYFGQPDVFQYFNENYAEAYKYVFELPKIRAEEVRMIFDNNTYPSEFTANTKFPTFSRQRVLNWLIEFCDIVETLVGAEEANYLIREHDEPSGATE